MPEDVYMQHLRGSLTESAAATLTEGTVATGATVGGMVKGEAIACEFKEIVCAFSGEYPDVPSTGTKEKITFTLSVLTGKTAAGSVHEVDFIYGRKMSVQGGVATYVPLLVVEGMFPPVYQFPHPLLVPQSNIYSYIVGTCAAAQTAQFRIGFTYVLLTGAQVMEALEVWRSTVS